MIFAGSTAISIRSRSRCAQVRDGLLRLMREDALDILAMSPQEKEIAGRHRRAARRRSRRSPRASRRGRGERTRCPASRTSAIGSARSRRPRRSPRPCRWWQRQAPARPGGGAGGAPVPQRMDAVLANLDGDGHRLQGGAAATRRHRVERQPSPRGMHRPSAACAAASTPRSRGWRANISPNLLREARRSRSCASAGRATTFLKRSTAGRSSTPSSSGVSRWASPMPGPSRIGSWLFDAAEFDVCTLFYAEFKSVIAAEPRRCRSSRSRWRTRAARRRGPGRSMNTSPRRRRSWPISCRATSPSRCSGPCWRTPHPSTGRG